MTTVRTLVALLLGLVFGSFLTVVVHRVPRGESIVRPRSRCPSCGTPIRTVDNIPVLSWLVLRGRCHACAARISPVYPLIELATGGVFAAVVLRFSDPLVAVLMAPFAGVLVAIAVIDWRTKKIPNRIVYPGVVASAACLVAVEIAGADLSLARAGIGFLVYGGGLLIVALIAPKGLGMGDVKLAAWIGLVIGSLGLVQVAVAAGVGILLGGVAAIVALIAGVGRKEGIPYGPFLAAGGILAILIGTRIADLYLHLVT